MLASGGFEEASHWQQAGGFPGEGGVAMIGGLRTKKGPRERETLFRG